MLAFRLDSFELFQNVSEILAFSDLIMCRNWYTNLIEFCLIGRILNENLLRGLTLLLGDHIL